VTAMTARTPEEILDDPAASAWLKDALRAALGRDPCDAADDAEILAAVLHERAIGIMVAATAQAARRRDAAWEVWDGDAGARL